MKLYRLIKPIPELEFFAVGDIVDGKRGTTTFDERGYSEDIPMTEILEEYPDHWEVVIECYVPSENVGFFRKGKCYPADRKITGAYTVRDLALGQKWEKRFITLKQYIRETV